MKSKTGGRGYVRFTEDYNPKFRGAWVNMPLALYDYCTEGGKRLVLPYILFFELSKRARSAQSNELYVTSRGLGAAVGCMPSDVSRILREFDSLNIITYIAGKGNGRSKVILGKKKDNDDVEGEC